MIGYNMYVYCDNNPVNFYDPTGENGEAVAAFFGWIWTVAIAEPTPVGEVVAGVITAVGAIGIGVAIGFGIVDIGEFICEASQSGDDATASNPKSEESDPPQSIIEPDDTESDAETETEKDQQPSSPGKMQKEVDRGKAPKYVKKVHRAHNDKTGKPHVHFKDKTALNNDGSIHDKHNGIPKLTDAVKKWLGSHNWSTEIKL